LAPETGPGHRTRWCAVTAEARVARRARTRVVPRRWTARRSNLRPGNRCVTNRRRFAASVVGAFWLWFRSMT